MNSPHQHSGFPASDDFSTPAALPRTTSLVAAPYKYISGKLTRFLARNVASGRLAMHNARPVVSFTFDDVAASACNTGAALLKQYQAHGTFYISGGKCGTPSPTGRLATADQVKVVHANGHEIGCHTYSHTSVVRISRDALAAELKRNRRFVQDVLGDIPLRNFAYPYGDMSFGTKRYLGEQFDTCRAPTHGVNAGVTDLGALKSCSLENASIDRQGILDIVNETVRRNGWLLFASHDVDDEPSRFGVRPDLMEFALRTAREAGCQIATVSEALRILSGAAPGEWAA